MKYLIYYLLILGVFVFASPASAESVYSWKDETGRTTFGSTPPAWALEVTKVKEHTISRYSTDVVLSNLPKRALPKEVQKTKPKLPVIEESNSFLQSSDLEIDANTNGEIQSGSVRINNFNSLRAYEVIVTFIFADATAVVADGPVSIEPKSSASYQIATTDLPLKVNLAEEMDIAPTVTVDGTF